MSFDFEEFLVELVSLVSGDFVLLFIPLCGSLIIRRCQRTSLVLTLGKIQGIHENI